MNSSGRTRLVTARRVRKKRSLGRVTSFRRHGAISKGYSNNTPLLPPSPTLSSQNNSISEMSAATTLPVPSVTRALAVPATLSPSHKPWSHVLKLNTAKKSQNFHPKCSSTVTTSPKAVKVAGPISTHTSPKMAISWRRNAPRINLQPLVKCSDYKDCPPVAKVTKIGRAHV